MNGRDRNCLMGPGKHGELIWFGKWMKSSPNYNDDFYLLAYCYFFWYRLKYEKYSSKQENYNADFKIQDFIFTC